MLRAHLALRRAAGPQRRLAHHAAAGTSFESEFITERLALNPSVAKLSGARVQPTVHVSSRRGQDTIALVSLVSLSSLSLSSLSLSLSLSLPPSPSLPL
jgi:hypothetical protein